MSSFSLIEVEENIKSGKFEISEEPPRKKKRSAVWNFYRNIINKETNEPLDEFFACSSCQKAIKQHGSGNSNFSDHKCFKKTLGELKIPEIEDRKKISIATTNWCVMDGVPFQKVEGDGFLNLIEEIVNVTLKYRSQIDVRATIPKSRTVSNNVATIFNEQQKQIIDHFRKVEFFGVTTDMWTDDHKKSSFMAVTVHYIFNATLNERILAVRHFAESSATGVNLKALLVAILNEYEIDYNKCVFVSDRGANVVASLRDFERLSCIDHVINNVLENAEKKHSGFKEILVRCKELTRYFKKANLQLRLKTSLKSAVDTRWNSNYLMIVSIIDNWDEIKAVLTEKNYMNKLSNLSIEVLIQIRDFLKPFKIASDILESTKVPTIHHVIENIII